VDGTRHRGETVAVFSHADVIRAAIMHCTGMPLDLFQRIEISPASVSVLEFGDNRPCVTLLNETGTIGVRRPG
jgi:probable phosphoglycerate mutase